MIQKFVDRFMEAKDSLYVNEHPGSYDVIVRDVVSILHDSDDYGTPDPNRITTIDHGDYQGTVVFVIGADGYQPSTYWVTKVSYGSCGGCDTLQSIHDDGRWGNDKPTASQTKDYQILALHLVQQLVEV